MAAIAQGDQAALAALMARWQRRLLAFLARAGAWMDVADLEDLAQETWLRVVRGARGFDPQRPFPAWFFRIARNVRNDTTARRRPEFTATATPPADVEESARSQTEVDAIAVEDSAVTVDRRADVAGLLACLDDEQRAVVELRYLEDRSVAEVSEILDIPAGTVKSRLWHALARLSELARASRRRPRNRQ